LELKIELLGKLLLFAFERKLFDFLESVSGWASTRLFVLFFTKGLGDSAECGLSYDSSRSFEILREGFADGCFVLGGDIKLALGFICW